MARRDIGHPRGPLRVLVKNFLHVLATELGGVYNESEMIYAIARGLGLLRSGGEGTVTVRHLLSAHTALAVEIRHVSLTCRP